MKYRSLKYITAYSSPIIIAFSLLSENLFSFSYFVFVLMLIPILELFSKGSEANLNQLEEEMAKQDKLYDYLLYTIVPIQYGLLALFLVQINNAEGSIFYKIGAVTAFGLSCGVLGINTAHELGHRATWYEQAMSKALLLTSLYMHFFIEHNRGHHARVSTHEDAASGRYGESVYIFYLRSVWQSYCSAWDLEKKKLGKANTNFWSLKNEMLRFQLIQIALLVVIYLIFGWVTLLFYLAAALIGILLLETVNYIEHYGLVRKKQGNKYERTMPVHSWNSNHPYGRLLLFELSRHSDHHYSASRKYQILRHHDNSPQMPTGYPGMMILSLVPPLWFLVMNKRIQNFKATDAGAALA